MSTTTTSPSISGLAPASADELDPEERLSRAELEALQLERLQQTVRHAYAHVPLYTRKFDEAGVHPDDIRSLSDVAKLPFTTKDDLRETYPFGMFAVPMEQVARIHASSGTTGRPTVVGYTKGDLERWASLVARSLRASGIRPGMKVHNAYGYGLFTGGLGAHAGIEALGATVIPMSGGQTARQVQLIRDFEPDAILCTPSYLLTIADAMVKEGIDPRSTSLKVAVLGAEPWTERDAARARAAPRHRRARHLRAQRGDGPGRRQRVPRDEGRPPHLGGPLPARDHRRRHRRAPARRRDGRAGLHLAHEGGASRSSATAPATSRACCPARPARACAASRRSPAATTT